MSEQVGTAAEEAARLLSAVQDWARARFDSEHLATGGAECQVCPVCQGIALLRQVKPETAEHMLDAVASFVAALKSAVASPAPADGSSSRVQPIDIREG
ncbi:MAG: hypothetical protein ABR549_10535 [Mycobacteriales bacterium]